MSHETIDRSLVERGRGELKRERARCARTGRTRRPSQGRPPRRGKIPDPVMISERPPEVADRAVPGHWGTSSPGSVIPARWAPWWSASRVVLWLHWPHEHTAETVEVAMRKAIGNPPTELRQSVAWDHGPEMTNEVTITTTTGTPLYLCDPRSPGQRGSNENANALVRQCPPKETDLSVHTAADLRRIQGSLDSRPRATLDYMTPLEKSSEKVALTG